VVDATWMIQDKEKYFLVGWRLGDVNWYEVQSGRKRGTLQSGW
jgi:hypothetical protein